jgi:putative tricarboxylic transport membrane protein
VEGEAAGRRAAPRAISRRAVDIAVGAIAFLVGAAVMFDSHRLGAGWDGGSPESGYFPFRIGAIISIASLVIVLRAALRKPVPGDVFVPWDRFRPVLFVLVPTLAYILGIQLLGIYVASAAFIAGFMRVGGRFGWAKTALVSAGTAALLFWTFEVQFMVPLPKGPLEAWLGY